MWPDLSPTSRNRDGMESEQLSDWSDDSVVETIQTPEVNLNSRTYQVEMFEHSMRGNTIVAMDTGSGKTQIAKMRIEAELERSPSKRIWFCAPSVVLAQQQHAFLSSQLRCHTFRLITGLDNVQFWSTQDIWDAVLEGVAVVVSTPQVLLDALSHAFVSLKDISLLVFDEAHHCINNHPTAIIMQRFYHPLKQQVSENVRPHVLGLSASPAGGINKLDELEMNLDATCKTPSINHDEYRQYVHVPTVDRLQFSSEPLPKSVLLARLDACVKALLIDDDPAVKWLRQRSDLISVEKLAKIYRKNYTSTMKQMRSFYGHAETIHDDIGPWACDDYIQTCIRRLHVATTENEYLLTSLARDEQNYMDSKLLSVLDGVTGMLQDMPQRSQIAAKTLAVMDYLTAEYRPGIFAIVFVKRRSVAYALTQLFKTYPAMQDYRPFSFVGASNPAFSTLTDLADMQLQNEAFANFRTGKQDLCIATQVMEEGVDIQALNVVIRFDDPLNFRSFIQSRGRARKPDSKFVMVHAKEESSNKLPNWKAIEDTMREKYKDQERHVKRNEEVDQLVENGDESYRIASTGALLTYDNARQHLQHFCTTLSRTEADKPQLEPVVIVSGVENHVVSAEVILPSCVASKLQRTSSAHIWRTERMATKDAVFQTYKKLHMAGLVNDNLLPYPRPVELQETVDSREAMYAVNEVLDPWRYCIQKWLSSEALYAHRIEVFSEKVRYPELLLLLPFALDHVVECELYSRLDGRLKVKVRLEGEINHSLRSYAEDITKYLFLTILGRRLKAVNMQQTLPYLLIPDVPPEKLVRWFDQAQLVTPLNEVMFDDFTKEAVYLVRRANEEVLYLWSPITDCKNKTAVESTDMLNVYRMTKQLSFFANTTELESNNERVISAASCSLIGLDAGCGQIMQFIPSIIFRVGLSLRGQLAREHTQLREIAFANSSMISMALTSSAASPDMNYERLEYLGDALLKYHASIQMFCGYQLLPESALTCKVGRLVSNARLQKITREMELDSYITTEGFSGAKWTLEGQIPSSKKRNLPSKTLADVIEALLGVAFLDPTNLTGQPDLVLSTLRIFLPEVQWHPLSICLSKLKSGVGEVRANQNILGEVEQMIDYIFIDKTLLVEALTCPSIRPGIASYERLEFLGDAILDRIVKVKIYHGNPNLEPEKLMQRHSVIVNHHTLAFLAMQMHRIVTTKNISTSASRQTTITEESRIVRLVDHMSASSSKAETIARARAELSFITNQGVVNDALKNDKKFPWILLQSLDAPKSYSDIVESILAAIFIDSNGDLDQCESFLDKIGLMRLLQKWIGGDDLEARQPLSVLRIMYPSLKDEVKMSQKGDRKSWKCRLWLTDEQINDKDGKSKQEHEVEADKGIEISRFRSYISRAHALSGAAERALSDLVAVDKKKKRRRESEGTNDVPTT